MVPSIKKLSQGRTAAYVERADSFGTIKFMAGNGKQIDLQGVDVDRQLAGGLHCVGMKINIRFGGEPADFFERLHGTKLIVGVHDGHETGVGKGVEDIAKLVGINSSFAVDGKIRDGDTPFA